MDSIKNRSLNLLRIIASGTIVIPLSEFISSVKLIEKLGMEILFWLISAFILLRVGKYD